MFASRGLDFGSTSVAAGVQSGSGNRLEMSGSKKRDILRRNINCDVSNVFPSFFFLSLSKLETHLDTMTPPKDPAIGKELRDK